MVDNIDLKDLVRGYRQCKFASGHLSPEINELSDEWEHHSRTAGTSRSCRQMMWSIKKIEFLSGLLTSLEKYSAHNLTGVLFRIRRGLLVFPMERHDMDPDLFDFFCLNSRDSNGTERLHYFNGMILRLLDEAKDSSVPFKNLLQKSYACYLKFTFTDLGKIPLYSVLASIDSRLEPLLGGYDAIHAISSPIFASVSTRFTSSSITSSEDSSTENSPQPVVPRVGLFSFRNAWFVCISIGGAVILINIVLSYIIPLINPSSENRTALNTDGLDGLRPKHTFRPQSSPSRYLHSIGIVW